MSEIPYLPLYINDYEGDTAHLSLSEDGAYSRLIRLCWRTSGCSIPNDPRWIMKRMRVNQEEYNTVVKPIIKDFFSIKRGRICQKRLQVEFGKVKAKIKAQKRNGKKGGDAKSLNEKKKKSSQSKVSLLAKSYHPEPDLELELDSKKEKYTKEFELFLAAYTNRAGKYQASVSYVKARKEVSAEYLLQTAKLYVEHKKKIDQFLQNASTWLNQKTYLDYEPVDENFNSWKIKYNAEKEGNWIDAWGIRPPLAGWDKAAHGTCPPELAEKFLAIHRGINGEDSTAC